MSREVDDKKVWMTVRRKGESGKEIGSGVSNDIKVGDRFWGESESPPVPIDLVGIENGISFRPAWLGAVAEAYTEEIGSDGGDILTPIEISSNPNQYVDVVVFDRSKALHVTGPNRDNPTQKIEVVIYLNK